MCRCLISVRHQHKSDSKQVLNLKVQCYIEREEREKREPCEQLLIEQHLL